MHQPVCGGAGDDALAPGEGRAQARGQEVVGEALAALDHAQADLGASGEKRETEGASVRATTRTTAPDSARPASCTSLRKIQG